VSGGRGDAATAAAIGGPGDSLAQQSGRLSFPHLFGNSHSSRRPRGISDQSSRLKAGLKHRGGRNRCLRPTPDEIVETDATHVFYDDSLRSITTTDLFIEIGASSTVTDLLESAVMQSIFPDLYKHLKLVSSTPIRNMATLGGNFVNASPIGDMTVWFLALDATSFSTTAARCRSKAVHRLQETREDRSGIHQDDPLPKAGAIFDSISRKFVSELISISRV
jgi:hypothetical protein